MDTQLGALSLQMLENGWAFRQLFRLSPEMLRPVTLH